MKLRISGQSLRFRLSHAEVERLGREGRIEAQLAIAPGQRLGYRLLVVPHAAGIGVHFSQSTLEVQLPGSQTLKWWRSDEPALSSEVEQDGVRVRVSVEKDFDSFEA